MLQNCLRSERNGPYSKALKHAVGGVQAGNWRPLRWKRANSRDVPSNEDERRWASGPLWSTQPYATCAQMRTARKLYAVHAAQHHLLHRFALSTQTRTTHCTDTDNTAFTQYTSMLRGYKFDAAVLCAARIRAGTTHAGGAHSRVLRKFTFALRNFTLQLEIWL